MADNMNELARELVRAMREELNNNSTFSSNTGSGYNFVRDDDARRSNRPENTLDRVTDQLDKLNKTIIEARGINKKVFKSMLDGIPIYAKYSKAVQDITETVENQSRGQSEAFRKSAHAMSEFTANVGVNSKSFEKVSTTMAKVHDSTKTLEDLAKKREALENNINSSLKKLGITRNELDSEYRNLPNIIEEVNEKIKKTGDSNQKEHLIKTRQQLENLNEIPKAIEALTDVMNDTQLRELSVKHPELKPLLDEILGRLEEVLKTEESGSTRRASIDEISERIDENTETNESLKGALQTSSTWMEKLGNVFSKNVKDLQHALENFTKSIGAAIGEGVSKELSLVMVRQRFTGSDSAFRGYSARTAALPMGMSEADLLSSVAENRNVIRRMAQDSGAASGAGALVQDGGLREFQKLSREMGLMGKEGLDNILQVSDNIRVLGLRLDRANIADSVEFFRDTFKDLAITQEQMRRFFADMSSEGMLRALSAGEDARLASLESIQNEVEFRGKLARVLNQELELQKKRVRELSGLAYGGPGEAIKRSVGVQILAEQAGMDPETVRLLGEQTRTGGVSLNEEERQRAATKYAELIGDTGGALHRAVGQDQTGIRAMLTQIMDMAGVDGRAAVEEYIRRGGDIGDLEPEDIVGSPRTQTERVASEVSKWGHATVSTLETMQGVLNTSIGKSTGAIVAALGQYAMAGLAGGMGGRLARRGTAGMGKRFLGRAGGIGVGALATGTGMYLGADAERGSGMDTASGMLTGAGAGLMLGSYAGVPGAIAGTLGGAALGGITSVFQNMRREREIDRAVGLMAMGNFGAESSPEFEQKKNELIQEHRNAYIEGDEEKMIEIEEKIKSVQDSPQVNSLMQNINRLDDKNERMELAMATNRAKLNKTVVGGLPRYSLVEPDDSELKKEIGKDISNFVESEEFKKITTETPLNDMIRVLKEDIDIENEEKIMDKLLKRVDYIANLSDERKKLLQEGNQDRRKQFENMSETEIREALENALTGKRASAENAIIGNRNAFSRE